MFKVFAFLKRNTHLLSHDEYRAGHVGYHCGQSRRLKNIRGYLVNVWSNTPIEERLGKQWHDALSIHPPNDFLNWWDGFPEVFFDHREDWVTATTLEPTRATADGLVIDPDWSLSDGPQLFNPVADRPGEFQPCHLRMHEHVIRPVLRAEQKTFKLMQFFKLKQPEAEPNVSAAAQQLLSDYAPIISRWHNCNGAILNFRDSNREAAMDDFYKPDSWGHSPEGLAHRAAFCDYFDGAIEYHFQTPAAFLATRAADQARLRALEEAHFSSCWYVEVDENLVVMPNRNPAPNFYFR